MIILVFISFLNMYKDKSDSGVLIDWSLTLNIIFIIISMIYYAIFVALR